MYTNFVVCPVIYAEEYYSEVAYESNQDNTAI